MKEEIMFTDKQKRMGETTNQYLGKNGYAKCNGLAIHTVDNSIRMWGINSNNEWGACFIEIPLKDVDRVIKRINEMRG